MPEDHHGIYRAGLADAVVRIFACRRWPNLRITDFAVMADIADHELKDAIHRLRLANSTGPAPKPVAQVRPLTPRPRDPGDAPPGMKWCALHDHGRGDFVPVEMFGRNKSRPGGLSDWCKGCWRDYFRARRQPKP